MLVVVVVSIICKYYWPPQQQLGPHQWPCYNKCTFIMAFWSFAHVYKNSTKYCKQTNCQVGLERCSKFSKSGAKFFLVHTLQSIVSSEGCLCQPSLVNKSDLVDMFCKHCRESKHWPSADQDAICEGKTVQRWRLSTRLIAVSLERRGNLKKKNDISFGELSHWTLWHFSRCQAIVLQSCH